MRQRIIQCDAGIPAALVRPARQGVRSQMVRHGVDFPEEQIAEFCRRHRIRRLALFGSILRDDFSLESDIDVLVEFQPGEGVGYIGFAGLERELGELLGHKVDLNTPKMLSPYFRDRVLAEAEVHYVET